MNANRFIKAGLVVATFGLMTSVVYAQAIVGVPEDNVIGGALNRFDTTFSGVQGRVKGFLVNTFWLLAIIEFSYTFGKLAIRQATIEVFFQEFITRIMFLGFFWYLFQQGTQIPKLIVNSFIFLADKATPGISAGSVNPDDIIDVGIQMMGIIWEKMNIGDPLIAAGLLVGGIISFLAIIVVAAHVAVAILEFYVVGYSAFIVLAFGGSSWTSGYAVSYIKYAVSVGMKLFVLLVIVNMSEVLIVYYATQLEADSVSQIWPVVAVSIFFMMACLTAPAAVLCMMQGVSTATGQTVSGLAGSASSTIGSASSTASSAIAGTAGAGMAAVAAGKLGASQPGNSAMNAAKAIGSSAAAVAGDSLRGSAGNGGSAFPGAGTVGGKMAAKMDGARTGKKS